jgi:alpha-methylacyl-CoA racemase
MGPLNGVCVIEMADIGPAPFAGMVLADLGADVIRIDRTSGRWPGFSIDEKHDLLNRGKRSIAIDLKHPDGPALALRLVDRADVVIEGFRPGVMERLRLGPDVCFGRNPRLVYGRVTGWGQSGPLSRSAGHDLVYVALTGALAAMGSAGEAPAIPLNLVGDFAGGALYLIVGVLAALLERARSGRGQIIDAAIVDGTAALLTQLCTFVNAGIASGIRGDNLLDGAVPWYCLYETSDRRYLAVGPIEPKFFDEFLTRLGVDRAVVPRQWDIDRWPELRARLVEVFRQRTRDEWAEIFRGSDACVAPVLDLSEATRDPHLAARGTFRVSATGIQPAPAPRFSRSPGPAIRPPCVPGEHTNEVLREARVSDEEIADLRARGVVGRKSA